MSTTSLPQRDPDPMTPQESSKTLIAASTRFPHRESVVMFFVEMAKRASTMLPHQLEYLNKMLAEARWQRHVTDDAFCCVICGVEQVHAHDCPVRTLTRGRA